MESKHAAPASDAQLATSGAAALFRQATDVAHVCKEIVMKCVVEITGKRYVKVEGWMSIAVAHGCIASIKLVEVLDGEGVRSVAEVRRISDQAVLATAEGYVGKDEPDWYGGTVTRWNKIQKREMEVKLAKRSDHAIRAMAQTRAISRVLRAGFSHVVVLIDAGLATVPYEEIAGDEDRPTEDAEKTVTGTAKTADGSAASGAAKPEGDAGKKTEAKTIEVPRDAILALRKEFGGGKWREVVIHFGAKKDEKLGALAPKNLAWWCDEWAPRPFGNKPITPEDLRLRAALDVAKVEGFEK